MDTRQIASEPFHLPQAGMQIRKEVILFQNSKTKSKKTLFFTGLAAR